MVKRGLCAGHPPSAGVVVHPEGMGKATSCHGDLESDALYVKEFFMTVGREEPPRYGR